MSRRKWRGGVFGGLCELPSKCQHLSLLPEKAMAPHSSTLAWKNPMDRGAWWTTVHGVSKSQTQPSDFTFTFHFHALKKKMATHSSVLSWRIPGTAEPGGLLSMGSLRVGHDWSNLQQLTSTLVGNWDIRYCVSLNHLTKYSLCSRSKLVVTLKKKSCPWKKMNHQVLFRSSLHFQECHPKRKTFLTADSF